MDFNVFSPLNGGAMSTYGYKSESPFDLDSGLDFTRQATGFSPMPYPSLIGYVDGFVPLMDGLEKRMMLGRLPSGPGVDMRFGGEKSLNDTFPNYMGGLKKVGG